MTNMTGSKLSIFSHPGKITGNWVPLVRLRPNKQLPVFTSADDNMASNERFIQISEADTETFIQSMKKDNAKSDVKLFSEWLHKENEDSLIEDIEKDKLDEYLARFFHFHFHLGY